VGQGGWGSRWVWQGSTIVCVCVCVLQRLTGGVEGGVHVTDVTNASRTMLMNIKTLQWDSYLCRSEVRVTGRLAPTGGQTCLVPGQVRGQRSPVWPLPCTRVQLVGGTQVRGQLGNS
jgi:hypothetical protein